MVVIPGVFVTIDRQKLQAISHWKQYSIAVVGPFHNLCLALLSLLALKELPLILSWGYTNAAGNLMILRNNGTETLKGHIVTTINDQPILGGILGFTFLLDAITLPKCIPKTDYMAENECCSSILAIKNGYSYCIWDTKSLNQYRSISKSTNINVVAQYCARIATKKYLTLKKCIYSFDCLPDQFCGSTFHENDITQLNFTVRNQWTNILSQIEYQGSIQELRSHCIYY